MLERLQNSDLAQCSLPNSLAPFLFFEPFDSNRRAAGDMPSMQNYTISPFANGGDPLVRLHARHGR
jgi:hypothetical protein